MVKIQKISEIEPRLGFTEFDMLKKYRQSFATRTCVFSKPSFAPNDTKILG